MNKELTCNQISALINFYLNGRLNPILKQDFDKHLAKCIECRKKVEELQKIMSKFKASKTEQPPKEVMEMDFINNLSAYVDNELNDFENIKIKKFAIANPLARQDLENIYTFKKLLHSSFERTKNELKTDYSKSITHQIQQESLTENNFDPFLKLTAAFFIMVSCIVFGIIKILYF